MAVVALAVGIGSLALREPRFKGRTAAEWLDSMGAVPVRTSPARLGDFPTRKDLEAVRAEVVPVIEKEFRRAAFALSRSRDRFLVKATFWAHLGNLTRNNLGLSPPNPDNETEIRAKGRLYWSTALLVDLCPDRMAGFARFEAAAATVPPSVLIEASEAFSLLSDEDGNLEAVLCQRIRSPGLDPGGRALWVACLGHLGPQASSSSDFVRSLTRDMNPEVRREAIKALASMDTRDDVVGFIRGCATDVEGRQSAMMAFLRMGARARPAEDYIRNCLQDPDMLTSMFAKFTLDALARLTNASPAH